MNLRVFLPVTKQDFCRFIAREPEGRYEFEGGRIVQQMQGATRTHQRLAKRIESLLEVPLDTAKWEALYDWGVETAESVRYGDVVVSPVDEAADSRATKRAALVVEMLSPSSLARDLDVKPFEYMGLTSLQAYIVASQTEAACLAWVRRSDGRDGWRGGRDRWRGDHDGWRGGGDRWRGSRDGLRGGRDRWRRAVGRRRGTRCTGRLGLGARRRRRLALVDGVSGLRHGGADQRLVDMGGGDVGR